MMGVKLLGWACRMSRARSQRQRIRVVRAIRTRFTTTGTTVHKQESLPCIVFLTPNGSMFLVGARVVSRGHGGESLVSWGFAGLRSHPQLSHPRRLFGIFPRAFCERPGCAASLTLHIGNRLSMLFLRNGQFAHPGPQSAEKWDILKEVDFLVVGCYFRDLRSPRWVTRLLSTSGRSWA